MSEKFEKLKQELYKQAKGAEALRMVSDFIVWVLERGNHEDIADLFFSEAEKTKKSLNSCMEAAKSDAKKKAGSNSYAIARDRDVYMSIANYLGLGDCITTDEIDLFASGTLQTPAVSPKYAEPSAKPGAVDLDLDSLFD